MTIEELTALVNNQNNIAKQVNEQICKLVEKYINEHLPFKPGDKVRLQDGQEVWIDSISPQRDYYSGLYTGDVSIYVNYPKKNGKRSKKSVCLCAWEQRINKID